MIVTVFCVEHVEVEAVLENDCKRSSACCIGTPLLLPRILRAIYCCLTDSPLMLLILHCKLYLYAEQSFATESTQNAIFYSISFFVRYGATTSSKQCAVLKIFLLQDEQQKKNSRRSRDNFVWDCTTC